MRLALYLTFGFHLFATANPLPSPWLTNAYVASERLLVTISLAEAIFTGTFTFKVPGELPKFKKVSAVSALAVPVWFPETNEENPNVAMFWQTLKRGKALKSDYLLKPYIAPGLCQLHHELIDLNVRVGKFPYTVDFFMTTPPEMDTPDRKYFGLHYWRPIQEPGYGILRFQVSLGPGVFAESMPVKISYRQPLLKSHGRKQFFYAPILENLPATAPITDTNAYVITLKTTSDCELSVTYCDQHFAVNRGQSLNLAPKHFQPIRATVIP